jgi:ketopantoate reductase
LQPGDVELTSLDSHIIIEKDKEVKKLFSLLKDFNIKLHIVDDIYPFMNSYFIFQLLYLPVAMCNSTLHHFFSYREGRELGMRVLHEGIKTFEKSGKPLQKLPACDPQELLHQLEKKSDNFSSWHYKPDRSYNPLLQSLLLDKDTEAKELNGELVSLAKAAGVDSSWNWRLLQKLPRIKRFGYYPTPSELLKGI